MITKDLKYLLIEYIIDHPKKFRESLKDIINKDKIDWTHLSENPEAIHLLDKNIDKLNKGYLSTNYSAMHILHEHEELINRYTILANPANIICYNFVINRYDSWSWISSNPHPDAIKFLEQKSYIVDWSQLCSNSGAIHLIEKISDIHNRKYWVWLSQNSSAMHIIEKYPNMISWDYLSKNPAAIHLLEQNKDKINKNYIYSNPAIFIVNKKKLKLKIKLYHIKKFKSKSIISKIFNYFF